MERGAVAAAEYPPDFGGVVTVTSAVDLEPARHRSAQHLVQPDRLLRVALGPGVHHRFYPAPTAKLSPAEMANIFRALRDVDARDTRPKTGLPDAAEKDPAGTLDPQFDDTAVWCEVTYTAYGQTIELAGDPRQNPPLDAVLQMFVDLRGGR